MKVIIRLLLLAFTVSALSQEKEYFDSSGIATTNPDEAYSYRLKRDPLHFPTKEYVFYMDGSHKEELNFLVSEQASLQHGQTLGWYPNGMVSYTSSYESGYLEGKLTRFWENGKVKRIENYSKGTFIDGNCYDESGNEIAFFPYKALPQYPEGMPALYAFISQNFQKRTNASGRIILSFDIETDGSVTNARILRGINAELDQEAIRVIRSIKNWQPAMEDAKVIRYRMALPIKIQ